MDTFGNSIDCHTHIFKTITGFGSQGDLRSIGGGRSRWPNGKEIQVMADKSEDFSYHKLIRLMDEQGISGAIILQGPLLGFNNEYVYEAQSAYPGRLFGMGIFDPYALYAGDIMRRLYEDLHFRGFKFELCENFFTPDFPTQAPSMALEIYSKCVKIIKKILFNRFYGLTFFKEEKMENKNFFNAIVAALIAVIFSVQTGCASAQTPGGGTTSPTAAPAITTAAQLAHQLNAWHEGSATASGNTVTLAHGISIQRDLTVPAGVTLDLTNGSGLWMYDGVTLTVNGMVNAPDHKIGFDGGTNACTATINGNGTINLTGKGTLIDVGEGRKLTLDGVTLVGIADNDGPLARTGQRGELVFVSGAITGNTTSHNGAGVYVDPSSTFTMTGGEISGNSNVGTKGRSGGGVFVGEESVFTMTGGKITGNTVVAGTTAGGGGVILIGTQTSFIMSGGEISGNTSIGETEDSFGGGVRVSLGARFTMSGGTISGNTVQGSRGASGGGVSMEREGSFTMTGGTISGNNARQGGGVFIGGGLSFVLEGGTIYGSNVGANANSAREGASLSVMQWSQNTTARWGTGGTYTRGGVAQAGGSNIASTNDTLIATPAR